MSDLDYLPFVPATANSELSWSIYYLFCYPLLKWIEFGIEVHRYGGVGLQKLKQGQSDPNSKRSIDTTHGYPAVPEYRVHLN